MKLKKGSAEAKRYMAKIRSMKAGSKKKPTKKVGLGATKYIEKGESANTKPKRIITITRFPKAKLQTKKNSGKPGTFKSFAGVHKDTKSHNVKINVLSGLNNQVLIDLQYWIKKLSQFNEELIKYQTEYNNKDNSKSSKAFYKKMIIATKKQIALSKNSIKNLKSLI
jgi:hypothetical protein